MVSLRVTRHRASIGDSKLIRFGLRLRSLLRGELLLRRLTGGPLGTGDDAVVQVLAIPDGGGDDRSEPRGPLVVGTPRLRRSKDH